MKVLVTGAAGYLGSTLVKILACQKAMDVRAVVRPGSDISRLKGLEDNICYGDLLKKDDVRKMVKDVECIYHLAASTSGSHFEMMNTVVATDNLLATLEGYKIQRFILVSSFSVYQMSTLRQGEVLDESCPLERNLPARDSYAITKVRQEQLVKKRCGDMDIPVVIIRPGKIYGPGDNPIPPQLGLSIPGVCFLYIGGRNILPLTHVSNCAEAIHLAGTTRGIEGEVFNIVDDDLPTQKQYLQWYESILGKIPRKIWIPYRLFKFVAMLFEIAAEKTKGNIPPIITRYRAENLWKGLRYANAKAKRWLGWKPKVSIEEGVLEMLEGVNPTLDACRFSKKSKYDR